MRITSTTGVPRRRSTILASAAIAVSVMGLVALKSGSAHAFPLAPPDGPCDSWHLKSSALTIDVGDRARDQITIDWDANSGISPSTAATNARLSSPTPGSAPATGNASGNGGPTSVDLSFHWTGVGGDLPAHFSGKIDPQFGSVNGSVTTAGGQRFDGNVHEHFECVHHAAAPAGPAPANQAPAAPQAPHDAISLSYGKFGANGLPATVTNSSSVPGNCTYDSTPFDFHKDFSVGANTSTTFDIAGIPTGNTYNVKVQCTGQFNGATVVLGTVNTTKKF